ncbi:MAG: hypothetical protein H7221_06855 [Flavobacterium sp.]|nr:hypothetical protein [Flavobacterium sp.]
MKTSCACNDGFTTVGEAEPDVGKNRPKGRFFPTDGAKFSCRLRAFSLSNPTAVIAGCKVSCSNGNGN